MSVKDVKSALNAIGDGISLVGSGVASALNPVGRAIKYVGMAAYDRARTHDLHSQHSPEELSKLKENYMTQIGLKGATFSEDAFDTFVNARPTDFNVFKDTKGLKDLSVHEKLSINSDATKAVSAALEDILKPSAKLTNAQKDYKHSIDAIKKMAAEIPQRSPSQLIGLMMEVRNKAVEEIKAQHRQEIQSLGSLFTQEDKDRQPSAADLLNEDAVPPPPPRTFKSQLATSLGLSDADTKGIQAVKDNMEKDLKASQDKQLKEFETAANDSVKKLQDAASVQMKTFHFLANLYKNHTDMQQVIDAYMKANQKRLPPEDANAPPSDQNKRNAVDVSVHSSGKVNFVGMGLKDINVIRTVTGKTITVNADGSCSMEFGGITDARYRWSSERRALADFMVMAQAVRATGKPYCCFNLTEFRDKEVGNLRGREAYEAAIKCGFPPDKIEIKIDGVLQKPQELFAGHESTLNRLNNLSPKIVEKFQKLEQVEPEQGESLKVAKKQMETLRDAGKKEAEAVAAKAAEAGDGPEPVAIIANN